jgi:hypothetical protein
MVVVNYGSSGPGHHEHPGQAHGPDEGQTQASFPRFRGRVGWGEWCAADPGPFHTVSWAFPDQRRTVPRIAREHARERADGASRCTASGTRALACPLSPGLRSGGHGDSDPHFFVDYILRLFQEIRTIRGYAEIMLRGSQGCCRRCRPWHRPRWRHCIAARSRKFSESKNFDQTILLRGRPRRGARALVRTRDSPDVICSKHRPHRSRTGGEHQRIRTSARWCERERARYASRLQALYGLSWNDYVAMWQRQNGACKFCKRTSERWLCVDHCHSTGAGAACSASNATWRSGCSRTTSTSFWRRWRICGMPMATRRRGTSRPVAAGATPHGVRHSV